MTRLSALSVSAAVLIALTACSSSPGPVHKPTPTATAGAPIVGAELEKETAWGECQQLVIKKLKLTDSIARKWSAQSEKPTGKAWLAVGHVATRPLSYRYECTVASDAKGNVSTETLDWIYPA